MTRKEKKQWKRNVDGILKHMKRSLSGKTGRMRPRWRSYRKCPMSVTVGSEWGQLVCDQPGYNLTIRL